MNEVHTSVIRSFQTAVIFLRILAVIAIITISFSGLTFIQSDEIGLVIRFGKLVGESRAQQIKQPGLLLAFPYLIDQIIRVPVKRIHEIQIDSFNAPEIGDFTRPGFGYAITGDDNFILLQGQVKYQITDPVPYALHFCEPQGIIKEIATLAFTQEIASLQVDSVLIEGRQELSLEIQQHLQDRLDYIGLGVQVVAVEMATINPPREVRAEFDQVSSAFVQKETRLREAYSYRENKIPQAEAFKDEIIAAARAQRLEELAKAQDQVAQFYGVLAEYQEDPYLVGYRFFYNQLNQVLSKSGAMFLFPQTAGSTRIILPQ